MRTVRSLFRLVKFLGLCVLSMVAIAVGLLGLKLQGRSAKQKRAFIQRQLLAFFRRVHRAMGMRIRWDGKLPSEPAVLMGNHRSYVDAILFPVEFPVSYVARIETKSWPIIGWGASLIGTLWVDRKSKDSRRQTRQAVLELLQNGEGIVIFPEGTTHKGPDLLEYRPGMFYTCAEGQFPIVPVALEYKNADIAWVGNSWFIPHALHHFGERHIDIAVRFGEVVIMDDAEALRDHVRDWTAQACLDLRQTWDAESVN